MDSWLFGLTVALVASACGVALNLAVLWIIKRPSKVLLLPIVWIACLGGMVVGGIVEGWSPGQIVWLWVLISVPLTGVMLLKWASMTPEQRAKVLGERWASD